MFSIYDQRFRDILLLMLGFFGAIWFFYDLKNHHPLDTLELYHSSDEVIEKADSIFLSLQYQPVNLKKRARVSSKSDLIDHLQHTYGRSEFLTSHKSSEEQRLPLFHWAIDEFSVTEGEIENAFTMSLSKKGELISFTVSDELIENQTPFNRGMVRFGFFKGRELTKAMEDSIITELVNFQHFRTDEASAFEGLLKRLANEGETMNDFLWRALEQYVSNTYWGRFSFSRDSVLYNDNGSYRYATAFMTSRDTLMGVVPKIEVQILPAGVLKSFSVDMEEGVKRPNTFSSTKSNIHFGLALFFTVWLLVSFYLRIKARAVDTRPALVVAIITGFLIPLFMLLAYIKEFAIGFETEQISQLINQMFVFGVGGALTATCFFVITAVSDSVTRQYWPEKLSTWDLVRRGMFKNKPIGWAIARSISIGAVLAGSFVFFLNFFPELYIRGNVGFQEGNYALPTMANIIVTLLLGLAVVLIFFMILGNQVYAMTSKKWAIPLLSGFLLGFIDPIPVSMDPYQVEFFLNFTLGFLVGVFYINFDFLTTALGFFIFLNFLSTSNGWLVSGSPDAGIFYGFIITLGVLSVVALYFLLVGDEQDQLPEYVPEYIEDLAKEQRVKQELDIARVVQRTFLPNTTPDLSDFDSAAVCYPAQETGGDYYDIICIDDNHAAIAIGDVSGKGIKAAFYMTFAKGVIHSLCSIFPSPKSMLFRVNKLFNQHATRGTFISMIYGVLDFNKRTFTYIRAGHNPLLYKKANGEVSWLQPKGVAIGMVKDEVFNKVMDEETIELAKGDTLILYTDGITEAQNESEQFYGEDRLLNLLKRENAGSAAELRKLIIEDVRTFIGNARQYDDMTLVVLRA
ncbi:MAG: hypothetical protein ED557_05830 [Balneola sp.]|nr:MAG: hypothetical protein ED557_05830 [Balneola sp.]